MKKLNRLFLLYVAINITSILACSFTSMAQDVQGTRVIARNSFYLKNHWFTTVARDSTEMNNPNAIPTAKAVFDFVNGKVFGGGGGGGSDPLKLNIADTSAMLAPYLTSALASSTYATIGGVAVKLNIADTGSMLAPYATDANLADTSSTLRTLINTAGSKWITSGAGIYRNSDIAIGTTTIYSKLNVADAYVLNKPISQFLTTNLSNTQASFINIGRTFTGNEGFYLRYTHNSTSSLRSFGIHAFEAGNSQFILLANGNIGIGTGTPTYRLDVNGAGAPMRVANSNSALKGGFDLANNAGNKGGLYVYGNAYVLNPEYRASVNLESLEDTYIVSDAVNAGSGTTKFIRLRPGGYNVSGQIMKAGQTGVLIESGSDNTIHPSAIVQLNTTTKGFLPPRMLATDAEAIPSPAEGLMIYSTNGTGAVITSKGWWGYDGTTWVKLN